MMSCQILTHPAMPCGAATTKIFYTGVGGSAGARPKTNFLEV